MFSSLRSQLVSYRKNCFCCLFSSFYLSFLLAHSVRPSSFALLYAFGTMMMMKLTLCAVWVERARVSILIHALHIAHIFSYNICEKYVFICCSEKRTSWATKKLENYRLWSPNRLIAAVLSSYTHNQMTNDKTWWKWQTISSSLSALLSVVGVVVVVCRLTPTTIIATTAKDVENFREFLVISV